ncbi:c-type cytochrome [Rhodopseudomonas sp. AAP120]|uniref:c-type cytochrome n=1 Tax=Rhodopseudomonas sp. AAP120 TaxID=1523430 RepID=UPI0006B8E04D|nr:c-type cytochrome [Rhodopseudomonas sp. AAP120]
MSVTRSSSFATLLAAAALAAAASPSAAEPHKKKGAVAAPLIAQACSGCHGQLGKGQGGTPELAGYKKDAFVLVWDEFRSNQRPAATIMPRIARGYSEAEVAALADYFSSLQR